MSFRNTKYFKLFLFCLIIASLIYFHPVFIKGTTPLLERFFTQKPGLEAPTTTPVPTDPYEVFIRSVYYYPVSESLGNNSVAFVFIADYDWPEKVGFATIRAWNDFTNITSTCKLEISNPNHLCKLVGIFSTCPAIEGMTRLQIYLGQQFYEIPFETVTYARRDVVHCIAPLFAAEQWQILAFATHSYKRYGSFMHLYVRSIIEPVYALAQMYEKEGYLKMQPWTRLKFSSVPEYYFNPNQHVAFRSQEAAQTDCLLQYKESAEFVTFMDLDDILVPRIASTYLEEFRTLLSVNQYIHYMKENVYFEAGASPEAYSLDGIFKTAYFTRQSETGKYATRPALINHTTIHYPELNRQYKGYFVPREQNVIVHLKKMFPLGSGTRERKLWPYDFNANVTSIFNERDAVAIEEDFRKIFSKYTATWLQLPSETYYVQHIASCYDKKYYRHWYNREPEKITDCPNPDMCRIPQNVTVRCANADGEFFSSEHGSALNVHYARSLGFSMDHRCLP